MEFSVSRMDLVKYAGMICRFMRSYFTPIRISSVLHALNDFGLERISFL